MQNYEVEIKSLLGSKERANALLTKLKDIDPYTRLVSKNKQLNHYFTGGDISRLAQAMESHLSPKAQDTLRDLATRAKEFSIRTRRFDKLTTGNKDGVVLLVVKASVGDDSSSNGVARMEFEKKVDLTLGELDQVLLDVGFTYQAKWSREREEYVCKDIHVCLDQNAGYGYLAEFEKVVSSADMLEPARAEVIQLMQECGVEELPQSRLERMFAFYNAHWPEYYGTEKIFTIE